MDCSVRNMWLFRVRKIYVVFCCSLLSFQCKSITASKYMLCFAAVCCPFSVSQIQLRNPHHFSEQPSVQVSQTLRSAYLSHVIPAATLADQYWHFHRSDCTNTLIYSLKTLRTLTHGQMTSARYRYLHLKLEILGNYSSYTKLQIYVRSII
jgi:hypothetical protein